MVWGLGLGFRDIPKPSTNAEALLCSALPECAAPSHCLPWDFGHFCSRIQQWGVARFSFNPIPVEA